VKRTVPQFISLVAMTTGVVLFMATLFTVDREETMREARTLGLALPLVLLPSLGWHLLRAAGWYISFPRDQRPTYWRVFQVRLASDGVAYFTIRGVASEPLRVVLLLKQVPATVSAAATVLERTAMGIMSVVGVGLFSSVAVSSDRLPPEWQQAFRTIATISVVTLFITFVFLTRTGRYFGPLLERIHKKTGWRWAGGRTVHFLARVEALFLELARTDMRRIGLLVLLATACYALMALEVWIVFWAIGRPITIGIGATVETFTRAVSVVGGAIPANLGALEASNVAVVSALGLAGGGALALARRVRSLLWATLGLIIYPRDTIRNG
jgi:hypothetical protein